ncbi:MAG: BatA domain-containing protein [Gemmatimonadales bacterium]|nr:BatA domain-containing protein [Gemmatimonadales bacterium]MDZ4388918.1 BatA domain-containing protein [Gemmatimonadales bacterium]
MPFLAPLWLFGLAALALPIWLHLRDRTPPDVLPVGSVADLTTGPAVRQRRRISEPLLLLLRCGVLAAIALALAEPVREAAPVPGRTVTVLPGDLDWLADSFRTEGGGGSVLAPGRSVAPWVALEAAAAVTTIDDTLRLLAPGGATRWLGPRPVVNRTVMLVNPVAGGIRPPPSQIIPRRITADGTTTPQRSLALLFWWLALGALTTERIASRIRSGRR